MNYPNPKDNPARQALARAIDKAIADGAPVYVNQPIIEYAYPSSIHARQAVKNPAKVADEMLAGPAIRYADRWEYMRDKMLRAKEEKSTCG